MLMKFQLTIKCYNEIFYHSFFCYAKRIVLFRFHFKGNIVVNHEVIYFSFKL